MKKSKSCEEMIDSNDLQNPNDNNEIISLQLNTNSINERWHNRFSKENRQKLLSQQHSIDQRVKLTRAQKQFDQTIKHFRTELSPEDLNSSRRPPFFNLSRSSHQESYAKMQQEEEDDSENLSIFPEDLHKDDGEEMILSPTTLISSASIINNTSRC